MIRIKQTKLTSAVRVSCRALLLSGLTFLLGSCQWLDPDEESEKEPDKVTKKEEKKEKTKEEKDKERFAFLQDEKAKYKEQPKESPETIDQELVKEENAPAEIAKQRAERIGKISSSALQPAQEKPKAPLHFYDDFIILNGDEEIEVNLVFNNAPLLDVLPSFADALGFNFLADSDLRGTVTLNIDQKMSRKDLWNTFDRMLNLSGAGVVVDGTLLRIMALSKLSRATDSRFSRDGSGELLYFPLKNTLAKEAAQQIRMFLGTGAVCVELTRPNAVMIADDRANMPKLKQVLEHLDMAGKAGWKRKVIACRNILPSKLAEELTTVLPVLGFNVYQKTDRTEQPGSVQVTGVDRLQVVVISAATDEAIKEIEQWVDLLDNTDSLDQERVFVYKVRNSKAVNRTHALAMIYDMQGSSLTIDTNNGNSRTDTINSSARNTSTNRNTSNRNSRNTAVSQAESTQTDQKSNVFSTPVRVFADGVLNRLVIRTTPRTYASIKALLNRLDAVPAQVLLQVMVVEVTLTESTKFGLELSSLIKNGSQNNTLLGTNYSNITKPTSTEAGTVNGSGFSALLEDPDNPQTRFGYLQALAGNGAMKIISSPQLLVSSHTQAEINVGTRVPVITQSITNTSSAGEMNKNYQYQNTGIILTITPQVTSTNLIALKVKQELSNVTANPDPNIENPYINQRIVNTSMTIANGRTMIIGGLIQEKVNDSLGSVPLINSIPVLNRLLGSTDASVERSEILVLITGYIINERNQLEEMIRRYNDALEALNKFDETTGDKRPSIRTPLMGRKDFWTDGTIYPKDN
ncbi:MAG: hypothetical protein IJS14_13570 [Lentisphaeria bacterium]|nr:hypothetical protein [Lentisphaeria bacterium]